MHNDDHADMPNPDQLLFWSQWSSSYPHYQLPSMVLMMMTMLMMTNNPHERLDNVENDPVLSRVVISLVCYP